MVTGKTIAENPHWALSVFLQQRPTNTQVLYLVPDSTYLAPFADIRARTGNHMVVYDENLSPRKKKSIWYGVSQGIISSIIGTPSALFLPFQKLSRVFVIEEHLQHHPPITFAPYFHSRDVAIMLAHTHCAKKPANCSHTELGDVSKYGYTKVWLLASSWKKTIPNDVIRILVNQFRKIPKPQTSGSYSTQKNRNLSTGTATNHFFTPS